MCVIELSVRESELAVNSEHRNHRVQTLPARGVEPPAYDHFATLCREVTFYISTSLSVGLEYSLLLNAEYSSLSPD